MYRFLIYKQIRGGGAIHYHLEKNGDYSALSLKRRFLVLSVGISKETANLRKSRNANREPLHPRFVRLSRTRAARLKPLLSLHNLMNQHLSSPPQPRDKRGTAGVNRAAICVSRFAKICGFRSQNALGRVNSYRKNKGGE